PAALSARYLVPTLLLRPHVLHTSVPLSLSYSAALRHLHSFPTRRSSDLLFMVAVNFLKRRQIIHLFAINKNRLQKLDRFIIVYIFKLLWEKWIEHFERLVIHCFMNKGDIIPF